MQKKFKVVTFGDSFMVCTHEGTLFVVKAEDFPEGWKGTVGSEVHLNADLARKMDTQANICGTLCGSAHWITGRSVVVIGNFLLEIPDSAEVGTICVDISTVFRAGKNAHQVLTTVSEKTRQVFSFYEPSNAQKARSNLNEWFKVVNGEHQKAFYVDCEVLSEARNGKVTLVPDGVCDIYDVEEELLPPTPYTPGMTLQVRKSVLEAVRKYEEMKAKDLKRSPKGPKITHHEDEEEDETVIVIGNITLRLRNTLSPFKRHKVSVIEITSRKLFGVFVESDSGYRASVFRSKEKLEADQVALSISTRLSEIEDERAARHYECCETMSLNYLTRMAVVKRIRDGFQYNLEFGVMPTDLGTQGNFLIPKVYLTQLHQVINTPTMHADLTVPLKEENGDLRPYIYTGTPAPGVAETVALPKEIAPLARCGKSVCLACHPIMPLAQPTTTVNMSSTDRGASRQPHIVLPGTYVPMQDDIVKPEKHDYTPEILGANGASNVLVEVYFKSGTILETNTVRMEAKITHNGKPITNLTIERALMIKKEIEMASKRYPVDTFLLYVELESMCSVADLCLACQCTSPGNPSPAHHLCICVNSTNIEELAEHPEVILRCPCVRKAVDEYNDDDLPALIPCDEEESGCTCERAGEASSSTSSSLETPYKYVYDRDFECAYYPEQRILFALGVTARVPEKVSISPSVKLRNSQFLITINDHSSMWIDSPPYREQLDNLLMAQAIGKWLLELYIEGVFK